MFKYIIATLAAVSAQMEIVPVDLDTFDSASSFCGCGACDLDWLSGSAVQ